MQVALRHDQTTRLMYIYMYLATELHAEVPPVGKTYPEAVVAVQQPGVGAEQQKLEQPEWVQWADSGTPHRIHLLAADYYKKHVESVNICVTQRI